MNPFILLNACHIMLGVHTIHANKSEDLDRKVNIFTQDHNVQHMTFKYYAEEYNEHYVAFIEYDYIPNHDDDEDYGEKSGLHRAVTYRNA